MSPIATDAVAGVTAIDCNTAAFTVKVAVALWPPKVAVMTDDPEATAVARPVAGVIVATLVVPELQTIPVAAVTSMTGPIS